MLPSFVRSMALRFLRAHPRRHMWFVIALPVWLVVTDGPAQPPCLEAANDESGWGDWEARAETLGTHWQRLQEGEVTRLVRRVEQRNLEAVARIDSLYRQGAFGPPGQERTQHAAQRALKVSALSAFDYIADLATGDSCVYETDEASVCRPFGQTYVNTGAFPFTNLLRGRVGAGRFRMDYNLQEGFRTRIEMMVGRPSEIFVDRARVDRAEQLLLRMEYPSGTHGTIELLFASPYRGIVSRRTIVDRGDTLEMVLVEGIEGGYVRKFGLHRMGGLACWRSRADGTALSEGRIRVGAAAYFPHIELRLPWFLPDLGLSDVREFHVPHPIWERRYVIDREGLPEWLGLDPSGAMLDWSGEGPRPKILDEIFPDL